jgi:murein DD-endopeptidase MepM/ murein hydrolase activator NlpD
VRDLKKQATEQANELAALERRAEQVANAILARRNEIAAAKGRLVGSRTDLQETRDGRRQALIKIRASRVDDERELRALEAEQARVRQRLMAAQRGAFAPGPGAGPIRRGSGRLIWPVNGSITSPFGPRWGRLHAGIDIAAPAGTPIRAADSGRVVIAGPQGGYGNYTCVQHTSSLSTCYAHQSSIATSQGASVRQGQVIGSVGCTGTCFGDHLHFEVRVNGSPVNPLGYL